MGVMPAEETESTQSTGYAELVPRPARGPRLASNLYVYGFDTETNLERSQDAEASEAITTMAEDWRLETRSSRKL